MIERDEAIQVLCRAWEGGKLTEESQDLALWRLKASGASATEVTLWGMLLRRHAQRSGPKTNIVQRQGAARNDYEEADLSVEDLMELWRLDKDQAEAAIAKVSASSAIIRAAEDDRVLRPIFTRFAQDYLASDSARVSPNEVHKLNQRKRGDEQ